MSRLVSKIIFIILIILSIILLLLSTIGIETSKFNSFISQKINQSNENLNLEFSKIKFKLDIKEVSLYLETNNPRIIYRKESIPVENIKVYANFLSLIKSEPKIEKVYIGLNEIDAENLKKISLKFKPSNLTSFIKNKVVQGKLKAEIEIYFDNQNMIDNFISRGSVTNLEAEILDNLNISKGKFKFFADKSDVLIQNFFGRSDFFRISDGDVKVSLSSEINLASNFKTIFELKSKNENLKNLMKKIFLAENLDSFEAEFNNNFVINLDKTYKVKDFNYKNSGKIKKANFRFKEGIKNIFSDKNISELGIVNSDINMNISPKKNKIILSGEYSLDDGNFLTFSSDCLIKDGVSKIKFSGDYDKSIKFDIINYTKPLNKNANIFIDLEKQKDNFKIDKISFKEGKNLIDFKNIYLKKNKFISLEKVSIKTFKEKVINNDFSITYGKEILIKGKKFDASNLPKILNKKNDNKIFENISKEIKIDFTNIVVPLSEKIKNFKLIGKIEKGKFTKISSKGDFGNNNFLDITMKNDKTNKKKYLEIYSDITKPLLTEFNFFKGLTGGKLLYSSVIDKNSTISKLKIENFKVVNAPGMVKLLSLADLGGLADLAEGEGITFDFLEINMEKKYENLILNEILALGPSISVLMEGYQNPEVTSLRGTLVPAKTLNKFISKIPVIGDIVIPKELGEGLFGISFKMKGPPGKIKTTINPIRTITPRFIQKIIDKNKKLK